MHFDKNQFISWLAGLPADHPFVNTKDECPFSQFSRQVLKMDHVTVGLGWYSFEKPQYKNQKDMKPVSYMSNGTPIFTYADLFVKPLTECWNLPKWASAITWDKRLKREFTKAELLKYYPELSGTNL